MAFGRLAHRARPAAPISDINMTPLIDVMLVLLVIFIITAPLMSSSLRLDLPRADGAQPNDAPASVVVAIDAQGALYIGDEPAPQPAFGARLAELARRSPSAEVQLRADKSVPYGRVAEVLGIVNQAGLSRVGFVTAPAGR